ncbi:MAG TPA: DUF6603 domain-containing protein, partial [Vicinamibacterales bacterium]|nr:DUF6603 domain-containing protein [Vicinamibacterales bacterium]
MSQQPGTIEQLAIRLGRMLAGLGDSLGDAALFETLARLGLALPPTLLQQPAVVSARNSLVSAADKLPQTIDALLAAVDNGDIAGVIANGEQLRTDALALIDAFATLPAAIDSVRSAFPEVTDAAFTAFADAFPRRLLDLLIADAIDARPGIGAGLTLAGLVERTRPFETTNFDLADLEQPTVRFDRITRLLNDPAEYFEELYEWGSPTFDGTKLLPALYELLALIGVPTAYHAPTESNRPLLEAYVVDVTPNTSIAPPGLDFTVVVPFGGAIDQTIALPAPGWSARFTASGGFSTRLTATLQPPLSLALTAPAVTLEGTAEAQVVRQADEPLIVLGSAGGSRLEVKKIELGASMAFSTAAGAAGRAPTVTGKLEGGRLVVDGSKGDGFISAILSGQRIEAPFDVGFTWSLPGGLRFDGTSSLTILLPASIDLGPISISGLTLTAGLGDGGVRVGATAALSATLGPVQAGVSGIGFAVALSFPDGGGNLGPAQIDLAFEAPTLIGIAIDAGLVTGGGFLEHDEPNGRYAGMIALSFSTLQMQAIGLIDTRLPNNESGYSFLVLVSVRFSPIQLGFGFTLNGVGGLCGIHRDLVTDALQAALRAHNLDHVLFPPDPVANAPAILSDLRAIFPPRSGRSVFAPMFEIAWGGELELVRAELGIVVSVPSPIVIAVLGTVRVALPSPDAPLVDLHIDALGTIEFAQKRFAIDASLYDSRIAGFTVTGGMAMRLDWGDRPSFALAIG